MGDQTRQRKKAVNPYGGLSPFVRAQIQEDIKQHWGSEKAMRSLASPNSDQLPSKVNAYYDAWRKAYRNQHRRRGYQYIDDAFRAWELAVHDCSEACRILGPVYDGVEDFDKLPNPRGHHVRRSKKEIEAAVLEDFKANPNKYYSEE